MNKPINTSLRPVSKHEHSNGNLIVRVWKSQPGKFFCISTKSENGQWRDEFFRKDELHEVCDFIEDNLDRDIYACPHGFDEDRRVKENAVPPKLLWADLDACDPRKIKIKPTIAFESSPGRYVGLWVVDRPVTEELNRRLTYHLVPDQVGKPADKSGWPLTKVLRLIPGTQNYKYDPAPKVKLLWSDGPEWTVDEIEKRVPKDVATDSGQESDAAAIYKKYERTLPHWCRRELMNGTPVQGKRSEMLWKLEHALIESGLSTDEAFVLIRECPWNKFRDRRNGDEQLRTELSKAVNSRFGSKKSAPVEHDDETNGHRLTFKPMSEVERENIDWIYYPYLARGELTIVEGDPGLGKSYLMQVVGAHICDGQKLPSVKRLKPVKGRVVYFDVENSSGTVMKARLEDNGLGNTKDFIQVEEPFSIKDEDVLDEIYEYFDRHKPVLAVFDTINTYIGGADAFKSHEVQQTLLNFKEIAKAFNCSVVVLRHLTKSSKDKALYRGQGSIAFTGMARVVITVGTMPDEEDEGLRAMAVTKINVAPTPKALTFKIVALPDTLKQRNRSKFEWGEFVDATSEEIISNGSGASVQKKADVAEELLKTFLADGPRPTAEVEGEAHRGEIAPRTLDRARKSLGVISEKKGEVWQLSLPGHDQQRQ